jgi:hypothetical protein
MAATALLDQVVSATAEAEAVSASASAVPDPVQVALPADSTKRHSFWWRKEKEAQGKFPYRSSHSRKEEIQGNVRARSSYRCPKEAVWKLRSAD